MMQNFGKEIKALCQRAACMMAVALLACSCTSEQKKGEDADSTVHTVDSVAIKAAIADSIAKADSIAAHKEPQYDESGQLIADDVDQVMERFQEERGAHMGGNHPDKKVVYLTFDDGPSNVTPKILKILRDEGVHATFFVTGQDPSCFDYIRQAYEQGNAIAAHTYSHKFSIYSTYQSYFEDLNRIQSVIKQMTGSRSKIIRFPGGSSNTVYYKNSHDSLYMVRLTQAVRDSGYQYVDWNADSGDASGINVPSSTLIKRACSASHNDVCLLMHDTYGKGTTAEALPTIIHYFKEHGYEFATLKDPSYVCHHGIRPYRTRGGKSSKSSKTNGSSNNSANGSSQPKAAESIPATPEHNSQPSHEEPAAPAIHHEAQSAGAAETV